MTCKTIIGPTAQAEIDQQAVYLAEHAGETVAYRFLAAIEETVGLIVKMPAVGSPWISDHPRLQQIRKHAVAGFPNYGLFYRHDDQAVEVVHLYHGKQDVGSRLTDEADAAAAEPEANG